MSENITRRAALSTTGRAAVATLSLRGLAVAGTDPTADAELLRLEGEVAAARERWREPSDVWNNIQEKVFTAAPAWPKRNLSSMPEEIRARFDSITVGELATIFEVSPEHPYAVWQRENGAQEKAAYAQCHAMPSAPALRKNTASLRPTKHRARKWIASTKSAVSCLPRGPPH